MKRRRTRQFQRGDRDANEKDMYPVLKAAQQEYKLLPTGFGADLLLVSAPMAFVEIKNGKDAKLTETEKALKWHCEIQGIQYFIIRTVEDAADMLNRRQARAELNKVSLTLERES